MNFPARFAILRKVKGGAAMKERYSIVLDGQLGERRGTLTLERLGEQVEGVISLLGFDNGFTGECSGGIMRLRHSLRTPVSDHICTSTVELTGDGLCGLVRTGSALMKLRGDGGIRRRADAP